MATPADYEHQCIAGIRRTIAAVRQNEIVRRGMTSKPTLFLLGVDEAVRQDLQDLTGPAGCDIECHSSVRSFLDSYDPDRPGCVILDITTAASDTVELQHRVSNNHPVLPIIILAGEGPLPPIQRGFTLGPVDLLRKPVEPAELRRAAATALARDHDERCRGSLVAEVHARAAQLTDQERNVMELMVQGLAQKHIAARLNISVRTVQVRRSAVMRKMQSESVADLVRFSLILDRPNPTAGEPVRSPAPPV